jgi:hypothetical protein
VRLAGNSEEEIAALEEVFDFFAVPVKEQLEARHGG